MMAGLVDQDVRDEPLERLAEVVVVLVLGAMLAAVSWTAQPLWWLIPVMFLLIRPAVTFLGLAPTRTTVGQRATVTLDKDVYRVGEDATVTITLTNTTEEKAGNGINTLSEEYLHHSHHSEYIGIVVKTYYKCHATDLYFAFHPELISPPPNSSLS